MKNRKKLRYIAVSGVILLCGFFFISAGRSDFQATKNLEILFNLFREVHLNYVDPVDADDLLKNGAAGMLENLDPYTEFLPEEEMANFEMMTTGKYGGIGSLIRKKGEWVVITQPYKGFAADKAGLRIGDKIIAVDGESMRHADVTQVSNRMKGDPGTTFTLTVERFSDGQVVDLPIKRERITISGVPYYGMINRTVGYIQHDDFTEDCSVDIRNAITELKKQGMESLILDLRGNGGGILQEAVKVVGMFVPRGTEVVSIRGRSSDNGMVYRTTGTPVADSVRLAVLIGRGSASAAEIVAGALQDVDRAVLVGERSFGKGLVQTTRPVGYNSYVKLTTAKYYIPSGRCIQAIDYSHPDENGNVSNVPDSLIREFRTLKGRKVYDGGGVMPDVTVQLPYLSIFTMNLYGNGYIEDFAAEYLRSTGFRPVDPDTFRLPEEEYDRFIAFMADKEVQFESETKIALEALKRTARKEKYDDRIQEELDAIAAKITKEKNQELREFREEISRLIEDHIVLYHAYQDGVIRRKILEDETVAEAVRILADDSQYELILSSLDTARK